MRGVISSDLCDLNSSWTDTGMVFSIWPRGITRYHLQAPWRQGERICQQQSTVRDCAPGRSYSQIQDSLELEF